jgi:hypothetical protein
MAENHHTPGCCARSRSARLAQGLEDLRLGAGHARIGGELCGRGQQVAAPGDRIEGGTEMVVGALQRQAVGARQRLGVSQLLRAMIVPVSRPGWPLSRLSPPGGGRGGSRFRSGPRGIPASEFTVISAGNKRARDKNDDRD